MQQRGDRTLRDHLQWLGMASSWGKVQLTHLKIFNLELFPSKEKLVQKNESDIEGKTIQRLPTLGSIPSADTNPRHYSWCQDVLTDKSLV